MASLVGPWFRQTLLSKLTYLEHYENVPDQRSGLLPLEVEDKRLITHIYAAASVVWEEKKTKEITLLRNNNRIIFS